MNTVEPVGFVALTQSPSFWVGLVVVIIIIGLICSNK